MMFLATLVAVLLAAGEPAGPVSSCPTPQEVRVFHRDASWWLDDTGKKAVADAVAYVRTHPRTRISVESRYHYRGNTAVATVADALSEQGVGAFYVMITSSPLGGERFIPAAPEGYLETSIRFDCDG